MIRKLILFGFILFLLLIGTISYTHSEEKEVMVMLRWEPSIDEPYLDLKKAYRIYRTTEKGIYILYSDNPTENSMIGVVGRYDLCFPTTISSDIPEYWYVVTATDTRGLESAKSNEVNFVYIEPKPAPDAPKKLRRLIYIKRVLNG